MKKDNGGGPNRTLLNGRGEELLILVVARSSAAQLTDWLKLPLALSPTEAAFLLEPNECCQLRRKGEELLQFVMARASDEQWCKWLQIPLEHALTAGKALLVDPLVAAGAGIARAVSGRDYASAGRGTDVSSPSSSSISSSSSCSATPRAAVDGNAAAAAAAAAVATAAAPSCCPGSPPPQPSRQSWTPSCGNSSRVPSSPSSAAAAAGVAVAVAPSPGCPSPVAVTVSGFSSSSSSSCSGSASSCPSDSANSSKRRGSGGGGGGVAAITLAAGSAGAAACAASPAAQSPEAAAARVYALDKLCLHRATKAHNTVRMRELLAAGVDRNATDLWGCTALHRAAEQEGFAEPVRILLAAGLDVRARDMEGYSPLHFAAAKGAETSIVDFLAAGSCLAGRGINGDTPLHSAVRFLSVSTARILIEAGADETAENDDGYTPRDVTGVRPDGRDIEGQTDPLVAQRIIALLDGAPSKRRWKRRGWIVMLQARAQAEAARELAEATRTGCLLIARKEEEDAKEEGCPGSCAGKGCGGGGGGGGDGADANDVLTGEFGGGGAAPAGMVNSGGFKKLVEKITLLPEVGLFQKVVRFL